MKKKDTSSLPRYKSSEYSPEFQGSFQISPHLTKFKCDGELNASTEVMLRQKDRAIYVIWKRETQKGTEKIDIGYIMPTDIFLEFLDGFIGRISSLFGEKPEWKTNLGVVETACRIAIGDHDQFKKIVRNTNTVEEFVAHAALVPI